MNVPHDLLVYRARARLAAGKIDEAMAIARDVLVVTPGHIELVSGMVPELERLGKKREAAELFDRAWAAHRNVLVEYPLQRFRTPCTCHACRELPPRSRGRAQRTPGRQ